MYANDSHAITIGPSRLEVSMSPGEVAETDYYVQNEGDVPIHVVVEPENFFKDAYFYGDLVIDDWLTLDTYEFDLKPMEIKKIKATIKAPTDVTGEIVAQVFFSAAVTDSEDVGGVRARLGSVLYVMIEGTQDIKGEISDVDIVKKTKNDKEKLEIRVKVKNRGNIHLRPTGQVVVERKSGEEIATLELASGRAVHPDKETVYSAFWEEPTLEEGEYKATVTVDYGKLFKINGIAVAEKAFSINENKEVVLK
jgi:hypothetical protein